MKTKLLLIFILVLLSFAPVPTRPCAGEKYNGHPALIAECQHQSMRKHKIPHLPKKLFPSLKPGNHNF